MPQLPRPLGIGGSGGSRSPPHFPLQSVYDPLRSFAAAGGLHRYTFGDFRRRGSGGSGGSRSLSLAVTLNEVGTSAADPLVSAENVANS